jgi:NAD(P)-dependent dehydrogenase (short-subunit alcohol dehydrogenase family)
MDTGYGNDLSRQLAGRCFLITGSTQGLGETTARLFAARGAQGLLITGRDAQRGTAVAGAVAQAGCAAHFVPADLADVAQARALVAEAEQRFGTLHGVVNCAASTERGSLLDATPDEYDRMFAINTRAPFFIMQEAARIMVRDQIAGTMVNICSVSAYGGQSFLSTYAASKAALVVMTKNAAFSLLRNRIRANVLNVGWMDTPGEHAIQRRFHDAPADWLQAVEAREPYGRLVKPDEVARAAAYLSSEESGLMTGAVIDLDQGVVGCGDGRTPQPDAPMAWPSPEQSVK